MVVRVRWRSKRGLDRPTALVDSVQQRLESQSSEVAPVGRKHRSAAERYRASIAPVPRLLGGRSPSDVARFIPAIVVDPIKRVAVGRPRPDSGEEGRERVPPFVAYSYAATAVSWKGTGCRVFATSDYPGPYAVLASNVSRPRLPVRREAGASRVASATLLMAPTAHSVAAREVLCRDDLFISARTSAKPVRAAVRNEARRGRAPEYGKLAELQPVQWCCSAFRGIPHRSNYSTGRRVEIRET